MVAAVAALNSKDVFVARWAVSCSTSTENWHNIHSETAELPEMNTTTMRLSYGSIASSGADSVYISSSASHRSAFRFSPGGKARDTERKSGRPVRFLTEGTDARIRSTIVMPSIPRRSL